MAVYGYIRVSTERQATEGESLEVQERKLRLWCQLHGAAEEPDQVFRDEGVSGSTPLRERFSGGQLWKALKSGDTIVATKLDRLFRSSLDALETVETLQKRGVKVWALDLGELTGNGVAKMFMTILSAVAEFERERIRERVTDSKRDHRDRGRYLGGKHPFGYTVEHGALVPIPEEQEIIAEVHRVRQTGKSLRYVQDWVQEKHGRKLALATLYRILGTQLGYSTKPQL